MTSIGSWGIRSRVLVFAFVAPLAMSAVARAETPCGDQVCPKNWVCLTETSGAATPCPSGAECAPSEPSTYQYCSPEPCTSDADCAADMVCYTETVTNCAPTACEKGADCPAPSCAPTTESACVPRYVPPCESDADCGTGFTCAPAPESCACAGSAGTGSGSASSSGGTPTPAADGGTDTKDAPVPPDADGGVPASDGGSAPPSDVTPPDCTCEPSTTKACKLTVVACADASDCPSGFSCEDNPSTSCWAGSDGTSGCAPADPPKLCAPPYMDLVGGAAHDLGVEANGSGTATDGSGTPPKGDSAGSGTPAADPTSPSTSSSATNESSGGGCTIERGRGGTTNALVLAAFAALAVLGLRRRRAA